VTLLVKGWAEPVKVALADREKEGRDLATASTLGLTVQTLTPELAQFLEQAADVRGVVVLTVKEGSPAAKVGIKRGDVLLSEGREGAPIRDPQELDAVLGAAEGTVIIQGRRGTQGVVFAVTLPDRVSPRKTR
jgi:serine protease Do